MHAIFVAKRGQLDLNQRLQREHAKSLGLLSIGHVGIRYGLIGSDFLICEDDVDPFAWFPFGSVQKQIDARGMTMDEPGAGKCSADGVQVIAAD